MTVKPERRSTVVSALGILFLSLAVSVRAHDFSRGAWIKNQLDSQQQEKLRALGPAHPFGPPGGPPP